MKIVETKQYLRDIKKLKVSIDNQLSKTLDNLVKDKNHPSLNNKHIKCKKMKNLFSIRVNDNYRIVYLDYQNYYELQRCFDHDKYDRYIKDC